jgi:hypothetical protein
MNSNIWMRSFSVLANLFLVFTTIIGGQALAHKHGGGALNLTPFTRVA